MDFLKNIPEWLTVLLGSAIGAPIIWKVVSMIIAAVNPVKHVEKFAGDMAYRAASIIRKQIDNIPDITVREQLITEMLEADNYINPCWDAAIQGKPKPAYVESKKNR